MFAHFIINVTCGMIIFNVYSVMLIQIKNDAEN